MLFVVTLLISTEFNANEGESEAIDYAIILGAGLRGTIPSETLRTRLDTGLEFARRHPNVPIILSGGKGSGELITEAEAMANYLTERGLNKERLILETQSTTTRENIVFSKQLMNKSARDPLHVLIVTSDYHLFRAKKLAAEPGYQIYGQASESRIGLRINYTIRECFAVIQTFVLSKLK
ncbi:hypothetical protein BEP19_00980 [Ammoniphilus oxalaticus]|uniref:DUF218 domain-containing protein n=2 Tax=Ammoniphilus oxalaticus TaxID=66863 RepID=A0A419SP04_9BACL|nr:hypothetical protein BEP19_00980 [Ammoniphilus oxalaticus]